MNAGKFSDNLLFCNFNDCHKLQDKDGSEISTLWKCDWLQIMNTPLIRKFLDSNSKLSGTLEESGYSEYDAFIIAQAFLLAFTQENFVGPSLSKEYQTFLENNWSKDLNAVELLKVDEEELNPNVHYPEFLLIAKLLLNQLNKDRSSVIVNVWKIRLIFIHQSILEELTHSLYEEFSVLVDSVMAQLNQINDIELETLILIEIVQLHIVFHYVHKAKEVLHKIYEKLNVEISVEGLLGYRTKFQQTPLPQLFLKTKQVIENFLPSKETNGSTQLPKLLKLDDEVRLEKIKFVSEEHNKVVNVPSIIQTLILTQTKFLLRSEPKDRLSDETLEPYITTLLHQEYGPLNVRLAVLLLNIKQEAHHKRTVERSLKQCEELLKTINETKYSVTERLSYGFSSLIPKWEIQKQLGDLMISLGLVKTALDLYLEIQSWENVIECYTRLDLRHKAAEIIENELKKNETVKLYCLLGDAKDDPKYYEIAWKLSKETSGRAQRHWGSYYFAKKDYQNAIPYLQKSLEINSLQEIIWLRLGYAALMEEKWDIAVQAYLRYTYIEPNGFESWNNLAKALIKLGDKKRAHKILHEALKCNFNNWKIWENFMIVSVDTGNFEDVINAYNRLIDLKSQEKFIDVEILTILVKAVKENLPDAHGKPSNRLHKKLTELIAHQCIQHPNESKLLELSANLADTPLLKAQKLQKLYRAYTQSDLSSSSSWTKNHEKCVKIMNLCKDLCKSSLEALENFNNDNEIQKSSIMSQLSSARLSVQGCVRAIENNNDEKSTEIQTLLDDLKFYVQKTTEEMKKRLG